MDCIFDIIIVVTGVCLIFSALQMKKTGKISTLLVAREEIAKCKRKEQFILSIYPKLCVFGSVCLLFGIFSFINDFWMRFDILFFGIRFCFLAVCFYALHQIRKAREKFFL